jgi:hypothetical protein
MVKRIKKPLLLWKGIFNYSAQVIVKHTYAPSEKAAKARIINRLAKEHGVHPALVAEIFDGSKDNFIIEVDPVWKSEHQGAIEGGENKKH